MRHADVAKVLTLSDAYGEVVERPGLLGKKKSSLLFVALADAI